MSRLVFMLAALAAMTGCASSSKASNPLHEEKAMNMKPHEEKAFVRGPPLSPAPALLNWLDEQRRATPPRLVRLPLVLQRGEIGFSLRGARIGNAADALEVSADDGALGVGLADRALPCTGPSCAFLAEGYWRDEQGDGRRFAVTYAEGPLEPEALAAIQFAEAERAP